MSTDVVLVHRVRQDDTCSRDLWFAVFSRVAGTGDVVGHDRLSHCCGYPKGILRYLEGLAQPRPGRVQPFHHCQRLFQQASRPKNPANCGRRDWLAFDRTAYPRECTSEGRKEDFPSFLGVAAFRLNPVTLFWRLRVVQQRNGAL